ncbi:MAG: nitroreductase family protein [Bryobacteraceae bacterium]|nr:nitroreductase family protein [Bryobacteraceae bacterium]
MSTTCRKFVAAAAAVPMTGAEIGGEAANPDEILAVFARRQTVRRYKPDAVPDEHLRAILDAARRAPTCMNQQPWKFLVVRSAAVIERMKKRTLERVEKHFQEYAAKNKDEEPASLEAKKAQAIRFTEGYFTAPVYVVVLVDAKSPCASYALKHDGPMAAGYLMAAARAFGYGTAYLTDGIPEEVTRETLAIPARYERICVTPIGIPDGWPKRQPKRKLDEMVAYETLEGHRPNERLPYNP